MGDKLFMQRALELAALAADEGEVPVGAVVVKNSKVIGEGRNRREGEKTPLAHAELEAIHNAARALGDWRLSGCELFVTLEPCPMCSAAIVSARLDRLVFGAYDEKGGGVLGGKALFGGLENRVSVLGGYMQEQCREVLEQFFASLRGQKAEN